MDVVKEATCLVSHDVVLDLDRARRKDSPFRLEYVLPDGLTNIRGYIRDVEKEREAEERAKAVSYGEEDGGGSDPGRDDGERESRWRGIRTVDVDPGQNDGEGQSRAVEGHTHSRCGRCLRALLSRPLRSLA